MKGIFRVHFLIVFLALGFSTTASAGTKSELEYQKIQGVCRPPSLSALETILENEITNAYAAAVIKVASMSVTISLASPPTLDIDNERVSGIKFASLGNKGDVTFEHPDSYEPVDIPCEVAANVKTRVQLYASDGKTKLPAWNSSNSITLNGVFSGTSVKKIPQAKYLYRSAASGSKYVSKAPFGATASSLRAR